MKAYISLEEAQKHFGTSDVSKLLGKRVNSPYGEHWIIVKAEYFPGDTIVLQLE